MVLSCHNEVPKYVYKEQPNKKTNENQQGRKQLNMYRKDRNVRDRALSTFPCLLRPKVA